MPTTPTRQELRWARMQDSLLDEPSYLHYDIVWLSDWSSRSTTGCCYGSISEESRGAAMLVVHAWSSIEPRVKGMLAQAQ